MNQSFELNSERRDYRHKIAWECRYFMAQLPVRFSKTLVSFFPHADQKQPEVEYDIYLLKKNINANVKLRKPDFLKLKIQTDNNNDGFEEWREEFKSQLPAPAGDWQIIARHFDIPSLENLNGLSTIGKVLNTIRSDFSKIQIIEIKKKRQFYHCDPARLEIAELYCRSKRFFSVQFESRNLQDARRLHHQLSGSCLGQPQNYISFLLEKIK